MNENWTVKQVSQLTGLTVRTLHHYDQIGLLKPAFVAENGYRYYNQENLARLQEILYFVNWIFLSKIFSSFCM